MNFHPFGNNSRRLSTALSALTLGVGACTAPPSNEDNSGIAIRSIATREAYIEATSTSTDDVGLGRRGEDVANNSDLGGSALADIIGMVETLDSHLLVLDRDYKKLVEFDSTGKFLRVIVGGYGAGPGRFLFPRSLAVSPSGDTIAVLDRNRNDIQMFDRSGAPLGGFKLPYSNAFQVVWADAGLYVRRFVGAGDHAIMVHDLRGSITDSAGQLGGKALRLAKGGYTGILNVAGSEVLYAHPVPGVIENVTSRALVGTDIEPSLDGVVRQVPGAGTSVFSSPVRVLGVGRLARSDRNYLAYSTLPVGDTTATETAFLVIFDRQWHPLRRTILDYENVLSVEASLHRPDRIYVVTAEPQPRVAYLTLLRDLLE